ncbi:hypothetical protein V6N13_005455 [Hibiscus sabdariffa]
MPLSELAAVLRCEPSRLYRIMRFLVHYQVFIEEPISQHSTGFALTPLSRRLIKHGEKTMAPFILLESSPTMLGPWHNLSARRVLLDWDDEECIRILKKCREAIPEDKGKAIIVEAVVEENRDDELESARLMLDMVIMAHTNRGKQRTLKEWSYVLQESGFTRFNVKPIRAIQSVIEAYP